VTEHAQLVRTRKAAADTRLMFHCLGTRDPENDVAILYIHDTEYKNAVRSFREKCWIEWSARQKIGEKA
jgi:hypothetical protein